MICIDVDVFYLIFHGFMLLRYSCSPPGIPIAGWLAGWLGSGHFQPLSYRHSYSPPGIFKGPKLFLWLSRYSYSSQGTPIAGWLVAILLSLSSWG